MATGAILILRLGLGIMFVAHGLQMAFGLFRGPGIAGFSKMLSSLGFSPAVPWAYLAAYTALLGGILLILGLYLKIAALFLIIFMLVAALKVHLVKGFFITDGGFEYNFIIICALLALYIAD